MKKVCYIQKKEGWDHLEGKIRILCGWSSFIVYYPGEESISEEDFGNLGVYIPRIVDITLILFIELIKLCNQWI